MQEVYDRSWTQGGYPAQSCWGCRFGADVVTRLPFHSVLDAGTGNGALVRLMRKHGARGAGEYRRSPPDRGRDVGTGTRTLPRVCASAA